MDFWHNGYVVIFGFIYSHACLSSPECDSANYFYSKFPTLGPIQDYYYPRYIWSCRPSEEVHVDVYARLKRFGKGESIEKL